MTLFAKKPRTFLAVSALGPSAAIIVLVAAPESLGRVVVVGQGYVGLPVAVRAVEAGYEVIGFDLDEAR
ncbi:MAG: hypothetical protein WKF86_02315, partial [Acidimicrobiales bacterium]